MQTTGCQSRFSTAEEVAHSLTHGVGALLSVAGLIAMLSVASLSGSRAHVLSAAIFGGTLVVLYTASALYHGVTARRAKRFFRICDFCAIYLLIAGTYTPFATISIGGRFGWTLLAVIWLLAAIGITYVLSSRGRGHRVSVALYVAMGWLGIVAVEPLVANLPSPGPYLLLAGGVAYTVGIAFFRWRRLRFHHLIWHLFVLAGSALHFFAVLLYVLPSPA